MKQVTKTLSMLVLVVGSTLAIGGAFARPPGGGGVVLPPGPWVPPSFDVWHCYYQSRDFDAFIEKGMGDECEETYFGAPLVRAWLAPPGM